jgi:hypothetical protein
LIPSAGPESWRQFLAQPDLQWAVGFSARTMAHSWEAAKGVPPEIVALLEPHVGKIEPLIIVPEHKTALPGGTRESQSDVFMLARHANGTVACTIEGKVDEPFGPTVQEQMAKESKGKRERLDYLCQRLGLKDCPNEIRYQLLHRTASALIEADRFDAKDAAMIVHSFSPDRRWFDAYAAFVRLLGGEAAADKSCSISIGGRRLILGWACGEPRFREM